MPNWWGSIWLGLIIGYFLHLVEDSFSKQGVHWLAPFSKNKFKRSWYRYKVGGAFEKMMTFLATLGIIFMTGYWIWLTMAPEV